ncbi:MAG: hypothetical protein ACO266_11270, partial [Steroidobacteraceae bacterium]
AVRVSSQRFDSDALCGPTFFSSPTMRALAGTITYFGPSGESGREWFEMIPHRAGRSLRALCRMDDVDVWRDVTILLDAHSRPLDAHVRVVQGEEVRGSMTYTTTTRGLEYRGMTAEHGPVDEWIALPQPLDYLGLHPLVGDALITCQRGTDAPGSFRTIHGYTNSKSANGESGLLAYPSAIEVAYLGNETLRVEAGEFVARHYQLRWQPQWPVANLWVDGDDALFLRLTWDLNRSRYELTHLRNLV